MRLTVLVRLAVILRLLSPRRLFAELVRMPRIATHNGVFHCDEVFACYMLKSLPEFKHFDIVRTRDPAVIAGSDVVLDVGGVYDHSKLRYDHHQREFKETMRTLGVLDFDTKLSSAGLVYVHYGKRVIAAYIGVDPKDSVVDVIYKKLYESFVEAVDAIDNGIPQFDGTPRYHLGGTLSSRVGCLNPAWNEEGSVNVDERFRSAMALVGKDFEDRLNYLYKSWLPARDIVADAVKGRLDVDSSGRIFVLNRGGVPWKEHFFTIESELGLTDANITYIVYADTTSGHWRVQAIPVNEKSGFENRLPLPEAWRGYRDEELSRITGIPDCIFVHATGFIGGNVRRDGAIEMARRALEIGATAAGS